MHKLILVREIAVFHRLDKIYHLRLSEKLATWRSIGFDRIEVQDEKQHRSQGHMCSVDDLEHYQIDVHFDPRRPSKPQIFIASMWVEVNVLK